MVRNKVLVIREKGDGKEYGYMDLTSKEVFTSPYYYLRPNDIIYVEPRYRPFRTIALEFAPVITLLTTTFYFIQFYNLRN